MPAAAIKNLNFTMQAIARIEPFTTIAAPNLLSANKTEILETVENTGLWTFNHSLR